MRIVVDTNVLVSAAMSTEGHSRQVLRMCLTGGCKPVIGNALLAEYEDVLFRPEIVGLAPVPENERRELLDAFLSVCDWVPIYFLWRPNLADEADNHLIELALASGANSIVTYNVRDFAGAELLFPEVEILTPLQFMTIGGR
ncbi:MAG: putative toxin-antitoxin system toxin component, PIN family [Mesorhizobium sp.]|nr:putative toxin-antitoxin system toxin component, PIN family [Mesorhizobium sp.]MCO5160126.1 putative toxin-antitoxin system toxin component, PIN family [Mesorhizobium sp.]